MSILQRRIIFLSTTFVSMALLFSLMVFALSKDGFSWAECIMLLCFAVTLPWTVIGFWNAVIGFLLMRLTKQPAEYVFPQLGEFEQAKAITTKTALTLCVRNEDVAMIERNVDAMVLGLEASGDAHRFHLFILSDSYEPEICQLEEILSKKLKSKWQGVIDVTYRRRADNPGFKAGNIRDFCERWGHEFDFMLTLDADSVMSANTILRMVRLMEQNDRLGIVQSLVVGLPSSSPFTRVFQFGMRLGMRSYTLGSAWWQADCGPYWGHNALLRMKPFIEHCNLPKIKGDGPLSGWILSHDQVEAAYMRRAGYECRVLAEESDSFEENPPHILEFIRRDLRWCHGNMQYFGLLTEPGLKPTSRVQLILAILMFVGSPAWMLFAIVATGSLALTDWVPVSMHIEQAGYPLFIYMMTMIFAPKLASVADTLLTNRLRNGFGGLVRVLFGAVSEFLFSMLLAPIMAVANTLFLFKLFVLKKPKSWVAQTRMASSLPVAVVTRHLWPQTLFGAVGLYAVVTSAYSNTFVYLLSLPVFLGPFLSVLIGKVTSSEALGALLAKFGAWQLPEETETPEIVEGLRLPALAAKAVTASGMIPIAQPNDYGRGNSAEGHVDPAE